MDELLRMNNGKELWIPEDVADLIARLQSTITAQELIIKRLKEDAEYWYQSSQFLEIVGNEYCERERIHKAFMNELGEK